LVKPNRESLVGPFIVGALEKPYVAYDFPVMGLAVLLPLNGETDPVDAQLFGKELEPYLTILTLC
jgi:hypothetical protein